MNPKERESQLIARINSLADTAKAIREEMRAELDNSKELRRMLIPSGNGLTVRECTLAKALLASLRWSYSDTALRVKNPPTPDPADWHAEFRNDVADMRAGYELAKVLEEKC